MKEQIDARSYTGALWARTKRTPTSIEVGGDPPEYRGGGKAV